MRIRLACFCYESFGVLLALLVLAVSSAGEDAVSRLPVPDSAQLSRSLALVRDLFGDQYEQAKTDRQKSALAKKLLRQAALTRGNPADRFALLHAGREVATLAGDAETALECVDRMAAGYAIDGLAKKVETLEEITPSVRLPRKSGELAERLNALIGEAVTGDRLPLAVRLSKLMSDAALRSRNVEIRKRAAARKEQVEQLAQQRAAYEKAIAVLRAKPGDRAANQAVGEYRCFVQGDWERGISNLALGSDAAIRSVAKQDLMAPKEPAERVALGDRWWELAEQKPAAVQAQILARAARWYVLAQPELSGLRKAKVQLRLADFEKRFGPVPARPEPVSKEMDLIALVDPKKHVVRGTWQVRNKELSLTEPSLFNRLRFPVIPQGSYELEVEFTRTRGKEGIVTMLPVGNSYGMVQLSGWEGRFAGIGDLNGAKANERRNPTTRPGGLESGVRHKMVIRVTLDNGKEPKEAEIHVALDKNKDYLHWSGPQSAISLPSFWPMPKPGAIGVGTYRDPVVYHSIKLRMLDGQAKIVPDEPPRAGSGASAGPGKPLEIGHPMR